MSHPSQFDVTSDNTTMMNDNIEKTSNGTSTTASTSNCTSSSDDNCMVSITCTSTSTSERIDTSTRLSSHPALPDRESYTQLDSQPVQVQVIDSKVDDVDDDDDKRLNTENQRRELVAKCLHQHRELLQESQLRRSTNNADSIASPNSIVEQIGTCAEGCIEPAALKHHEYNEKLDIAAGCNVNDGDSKVDSTGQCGEQSMSTLSNSIGQSAIEKKTTSSNDEPLSLINKVIPIIVAVLDAVMLFFYL
jgi:hypothetical protein